MGQAVLTIAAYEHRLKDRVHIQDMDAVGLITSELAAGLPDVLRARLREVRAAE